MVTVIDCDGFSITTVSARARDALIQKSITIYHTPTLPLKTVRIRLRIFGNNSARNPWQAGMVGRVRTPADGERVQEDRRAVAGARL
jgi:hypothetical protein